MLCPLCKKPTVLKFKPFCSDSCKNIDLLNWLNQNYKIPQQNTNPDEITQALDDY